MLGRFARQSEQVRQRLLDLVDNHIHREFYTNWDAPEHVAKMKPTIVNDIPPYGKFVIKVAGGSATQILENRPTPWRNPRLVLSERELIAATLEFLFRKAQAWDELLRLGVDLDKTLSEDQRLAVLQLPCWGDSQLTLSGFDEQFPQKVKTAESAHLFVSQLPSDACEGVEIRPPANVSEFSGTWEEVFWKITCVNNDDVLVCFGGDWFLVTPESQIFTKEDAEAVAVQVASFLAGLFNYWVGVDRDTTKTAKTFCLRYAETWKCLETYASDVRNFFPPATKVCFDELTPEVSPPLPVKILPLQRSKDCAITVNYT